jgi:hypothetical protein
VVILSLAFKCLSFREMVKTLARGDLNNTAVPFIIKGNIIY